MTVTAIAHPNIALVKYWGKRDIPLNLPAVPSLSLTLGPWRTRTSVTWGTDRDEVVLDGRAASEAEARRALRFVDHIDPVRPPCRIETDNDFPTGAGLASSASGFAALALAATMASGHPSDSSHLSRIARIGSGSACRSLWGGFVRWDRGERDDGLDSHGVPVETEPWDLRMVVAIIDEGKKAVGSTAGMERSRATSPLWSAWLADADRNVAEAEAAVRARDLQRLGEVMERSTFAMHATMQTSTPPLLYWQPGTVAALREVFALRQAGIGAWATMDAGPQVKVLCETSVADRVSDALQRVARRVVVLHPDEGARLA